MASSFPKMQKSSASFSQSNRNRLRLKNLQAQAKNFCRVLDIRVPQTMKIKIRQMQLFMDNLRCVLHCPQIDVLTIFPPANKISFFVCWIFRDTFGWIFIVPSVSFRKIDSRPFLPDSLTL